MVIITSAFSGKRDISVFVLYNVNYLPMLTAFHKNRRKMRVNLND